MHAGAPILGASRCPNETRAPCLWRPQCPFSDCRVSQIQPTLHHKKSPNQLQHHNHKLCTQGSLPTDSSLSRASSHLDESLSQHRWRSWWPFSRLQGKSNPAYPAPPPAPELPPTPSTRQSARLLTTLPDLPTRHHAPHHSPHWPYAVPGQPSTPPNVRWPLFV